jgi:hypothetical protein
MLSDELKLELGRAVYKRVCEYSEELDRPVLVGSTYREAECCIKQTRRKMAKIIRACNNLMRELDGK